MKTVKQVSKLTGVSIRTLHHYDAIGLLRPTAVTDAGYRLYDDTALERLQTILLFRALKFPLKDIQKILDSPNLDRKLALRQQIRLLELQLEQTGKLLDLARAIQANGGNIMDFTAFDTAKLDEYAARAKETWGNTDAYREYAARQQSREEEMQMAGELMGLFRELGKLRDADPGSLEVQALVSRLRETIIKNYYTCTPEILAGLGTMYAVGGEMTENIDRTGGAGTAAFAQTAIAYYVAHL